MAKVLLDFPFTDSSAWLAQVFTFAARAGLAENVHVFVERPLDAERTLNEKA
jgi:hypothetical protein